MTQVCGDVGCPVPSPQPGLIAAVSTETWAAGTELARCYPSGVAPTGLPETGRGRPARFSPVPRAAHAYLARHGTAALLETAMRDTAGPDATVYVPQLRGWELGRVVLASEVKLADLRPAALTALGFRDDQLTTSGPRHYRCTLEWAVALHAQGFSGAVWHSRQAVIHHESAVRQGGIAGELLHHVAAEVAVVWTPPAPHGAIAVGVSRGDRRPLLDEQGRPDTLVEELCALLDITLEV